MVARTYVEQAAYEWWRALRPIQWTEEDHLRVPDVNCSRERERTLAKTVAQMVRREIDDGSQ